MICNCERELYRFRQLAGCVILGMSWMQTMGRPVAAAERPTIGEIERLDPALDALVPPDAKMEIIVDGLDWCEGPLWIPADGGFLIFSDIPQNKIYRWDAKSGKQEYLHPSGYTGTTPRGGESGTNGSTLDREGRLILCQHGDRRVARMDAPLDKPEPKYVTVAGKYDGKRFNSPNDATVHSSGAIYFTDPPYGLDGYQEDLSKIPGKELPYQGVYRVTPDGTVTLLTKKLERPNGIALSPDEKTLYVANSHGPRPIWMAYPVLDDGTLGPGKVFFDATELSKTRPGAARWHGGRRARQRVRRGPRRRADFLTRRQTSRHAQDRPGDFQRRVRRRRQDAVHHGRHVRAADSTLDQGQGLLGGSTAAERRRLTRVRRFDYR